MSSFEYSVLSTEDQVRIVEERLRQFESEHYANALVRKSIEHATDIGEEQKVALLAETDEKIATLERAIAIHRDERDQLIGR
jgi:hypothetical protein